MVCTRGNSGSYTEKDKVIAALQGHPWKRPDKKGRWLTNARKRGSSQRYFGPSKRTLGKRAAKAQRGRSGKRT